MTVPAALEIENLRKTFGGSVALQGVDVTIGPAEVHALVGQNGSGKSTLVKILAGFHQPDSGTARIYGRPLPLGDATAAAAERIRFVHQDLGLVDGLDAVENVALGPGYTTGFAGRIAWKRQTAEVEQIVRRLGYGFDVRRPVGELTASERVGVAIARAFFGWDQSDGQGLLVLDEPTASMPAPEVARLAAVIRGVRDSGTSVLYVSHRFEEVFALADRVTVFRDGLVVTSRPIEGLEHDELIELMLGRRLMHEHYESTASSTAAPLLEVRRLESDTLTDFDVTVRPGEVVGIAGVTGSGREDVAPLLFGIRHPLAGEILLDGTPMRFDSPADAIAAGIGYVPPNRRQQGVIAGGTVRENMTLVDVSPFFRRGRMSRRAEIAEVTTWIDRLSVHPPRTEKPVLELSGGNQQKVIVAKWLRISPRLLVLEEPTQGVDVGSKADIHGHIRDAASQGMGVVLVSTDLEEMAHLCDRVVVIVAGRSVTEMSGAALDSERLHEAILGSLTRRGVDQP